MVHKGRVTHLPVNATKYTLLVMSFPVVFPSGGVDRREVRVTLWWREICTRGALTCRASFLTRAPR